MLVREILGFGVSIFEKITFIENLPRTKCIVFRFVVLPWGLLPVAPTDIRQELISIWVNIELQWHVYGKNGVHENLVKVNDTFVDMKTRLIKIRVLYLKINH